MLYHVFVRWPNVSHGIIELPVNGTAVLTDVYVYLLLHKVLLCSLTSNLDLLHYKMFTVCHFILLYLTSFSEYVCAHVAQIYW